MFDKLIVSEPEGADIKNRRNYFMVSSFLVGVLFLAAVVFSIYAADFGLGNGNFDLSMMMAPPEIAADPETPRPQTPATQPHSQSQLPTRRENLSRVDEPTIVPVTTSTAPNNESARPLTPFTIGKDDSNADTTGRPETGPNTGPGIGTPTTPTEPELVIEPPPIRKPVEIKPPTIKSLGVITGIATYLPKPPYPATAIALNLQGKVDVQVMIDEKGKVISASAVSGHKLLRAAAENAAWNAKFNPTYLSNVPVKVTGVIVYNFSR